MEAKGEIQPAKETKGLDGNTRPKSPRSERPKTAPKVSSQHPTNGEGLQLLQLPQTPVCSRAKAETLPQVHASSTSPSMAARPSEPKEPVVLNQPAAANESPEETEEGCLECSSF
jgi:hypothetical protein